MAKPMPAPSSLAQKSDDDYRGEDDHRTLTRAEEIRSDSKRMAGVLKHQKKSLRALTRIGKSLPKRTLSR